jgi:hypothetical protein
MRLEAHADAEAFLAAAGELLSRDEARHNLMYGICSTLRAVPDAYPEGYFWTVEDGETVGALLMTPPFNIVVARPLHDEVLAFAAEALHSDAVELPGVGGAVPEVDEFADRWERVSGARRRLQLAQGVYAAREVREPVGVSGRARAADARDRELLIEWGDAFAREALPEEAPRINLERSVDRRLANTTAGFGLWEDGGRPVSLCGYGGATPHGIRIARCTRHLNCVAAATQAR